MKVLYVFKVIFSCLIFTTAYADTFNPQTFVLEPYFQYTEEELASLRNLSSEQEMDKEQLRRWDRVVSQVLQEYGNEENASRLYAYLYTAQRDVAALSYAVKKRLEGSFDPISYKVIALFFPKWNEQHPAQDAYSNTLTDLVFAKVQTRFQNEERQIKPYTMRRGNLYWSDKEPYGLTIGSWKPWYLKARDQFRAPPPPHSDSPEWDRQLQAVKDCMQMNEQKKKAILYWAGMTSNGAPSVQNGDWRFIANNYLWNHRISLPLSVFIRSVLATSLADAAISVFDSKYTYLVKRPAMLDPTLKPYLKAPSHPSYPSGHSTVSSTAAMMLDYFFPNDHQLWDALATEAGLSRLWCGIHFPIDNDVGNKMGEQIGEFIIERLEENMHKPMQPLPAFAT